MLTTAADLNKIHTNLNADYCLGNDIDAASISNFPPVGPTPYNGHFDGKGFVVKNLKITNNSAGYVAFISWLGTSATVANLGLVNATVTSNQRAAILVGLNQGKITNSFTSGTMKSTGDLGVGGFVYSNQGTIEQSRSSAKVSCNVTGCSVGGLVFSSKGTIRQSFFSGTASCVATNGCTAAGLVNLHTDTAGVIIDSYVSGPVSCDGGGITGGQCWAGGISLDNDGKISRSFNTGTVTCTGVSCRALGVFLSDFQPAAAVGQSFMTGAVTCNGQACFASGIGEQDSADGVINQTYATGKITCAGSTCHANGMVDSFGGPLSTMSASYYDTDTTGQNTDEGGGTAKTTAELKHALLPGFATNAWAIVPDLSYPFLDPRKLTSANQALFKLNFWAPPLASAGYRNSTFYYFYPIGQFEKDQYGKVANNTAFAAKAAVLTMLARADGDIWNDSHLIKVPIDTYFWTDGTKTTNWQGPVTTKTSIYKKGGVKVATPADGSVSPVAGNLGDITSHLTMGNPVLLRGTASKSPPATHWMLATAVLKTGSTVTGIVANDPWTGRQVIINPTTWRVSWPTNYETLNFKFTATGYFYAAIN